MRGTRQPKIFEEVTKAGEIEKGTEVVGRENGEIKKTLIV
jgi:hypothetical protein